MKNEKKTQEESVWRHIVSDNSWVFSFFLVQFLDYKYKVTLRSLDTSHFYSSEIHLLEKVKWL
jgi:hypothetical protein